MLQVHPLDQQLIEIKKICYVLEFLIDEKQAPIHARMDKGTEKQQDVNWEEFLTYLYNSINEIKQLPYLERPYSNTPFSQLDIDISKTTFKFFALKYKMILNRLSQLSLCCDLYDEEANVNEWKKGLCELLESLEYYTDYMKPYYE